MAKGRHRGAFVFGSVLGGAVGAVAALWKTPQSGKELRRKLGFESDVAHSVTAAAKRASTSAADAAHTAKPLPARALGLVEQVAAPLVGVKLGHTANQSQPGDVDAAPVDAGTGVVRRKTELVDIRPSDATTAP